jgi:hypothetical protein
MKGSKSLRATLGRFGTSLQPHLVVAAAKISRAHSPLRRRCFSFITGQHHACKWPLKLFIWGPHRDPSLMLPKDILTVLPSAWHFCVFCAFSLATGTPQHNWPLSSLSLCSVALVAYGSPLCVRHVQHGPLSSQTLTFFERKRWPLVLRRNISLTRRLLLGPANDNHNNYDFSRCQRV